ncbi:TPA: UDP-N-acetylmuramate--L-alanine ligase [bacterium]|nr:MAG: UDP-N-acetylmuramate--L-alanine ligase [Candidatus Hydrogenedentes bacterium CG1_02_42_14]PIU48805.1 MAG: UDP-N-acetylmuramate--L-alanine ligase [Candidatus Hydrogenedentes bacterium CG07_land_8_20_14_0_80_42_17]HBW47737.1 UDP-N-acetylmuramate--L-alanine ligase [bacterium]
MIRVQRIHFVGIGGSGMSGIAELLLSMKYQVSGSDIKKSAVTDRLNALGAKIAIGHRAENIGSADAVVVSSAVGRENPEVRSAYERGITVVARAEMLAELMRMKYGIAIAGTHGKTTTTSLTAFVLSSGGLDPTVVIGGRLEQIGSGAKRGLGDYFVAEADESDGSFLKLSPAVSVITNIDDDHLEHYGDMASLTTAFKEFANKVPFYGFGVLCKDDIRLSSIMTLSSRRMVSYGLSAGADVQAENIEIVRDGSKYDLVYRGKKMGHVFLKIHGLHNVSNSLAASAVGLELGIQPDKVIQGLEAFKGVDRRLQFKGRSKKGWSVYDDYGHHPTEITATIAAAKTLLNDNRGRIVVIFQPHRYSRTSLLYDKFATALTAADFIWLLPIYPAGEMPREGVTSELIASSLKLKSYINFKVIEDEPSPEIIAGELNEGDIVITLGAGSITGLGDKLLKE